MFVLGIDPGLSRCGYGLVQRVRSDYTGVRAGVIKTPPDDPLPQRLSSLLLDLQGLIAECRPDVVVVERVFFQTNARTAMSVGQASGLALAAASTAGCGVAEYTANEVKMAVTGDGAATKRQVQQMVQTLLHLNEPPRPFDVADALALALCHLAVAPRLARIQADQGNDVHSAQANGTQANDAAQGNDTHRGQVNGTQANDAAQGNDTHRGQVNGTQANDTAQANGTHVAESAKPLSHAHEPVAQGAP